MEAGGDAVLGGGAVKEDWNVKVVGMPVVILEEVVAVVAVDPWLFANCKLDTCRLRSALRERRRHIWGLGAEGELG